MEAPQQQLGWQLCPEAGGSLLVPGRPFRLKQGTSQQMAKGSLSQRVKQAAVQGMWPQHPRGTKEQMNMSRSHVMGTGHLGAFGAIVQPTNTIRLTRAQTVVSTAAKDGAGMQCGLASIDSKTGCLFFSLWYLLGCRHGVLMVWQTLVADQRPCLLSELSPTWKDRWISSIHTTSVEHWRKFSDPGLVGNIPIHSEQHTEVWQGWMSGVWERDGFLRAVIKEVPGFSWVWSGTNNKMMCQNLNFSPLFPGHRLAS